MRLSLKYILVLLLVSSCESKIDDLKTEHMSSNVATTEVDGVVTATISSTASSDQILVGSSASNAAEASVTFPPGALAISTEISIGEAKDQSSAILSGLGVTTSSRTGSPIYIGPSASDSPVAVNGSLTIQIPIPLDQATGLVDDASSKLGLLYTIYKDGAWKSGIIPLTKDNLIGAFLKQTFGGLGYFQVIYLSSAAAAKEVATQLKPSLGKNDTTKDDDTDTDTSDTASLKDYQGGYSGVVQEISNLTASGVSGNGKYCALTSNSFKLFLGKYNILLFKVSTPIAGNTDADFDGDIPSFGDISQDTLSALDKTSTQGTPTPVITDSGVKSSGVKYPSADQYASKVLKFVLKGEFGGTATKVFNGTFKAVVGNDTVCEYNLELRKQ